VPVDVLLSGWPVIWESAAAFSGCLGCDPGWLGELFGLALSAQFVFRCNSVLLLTTNRVIAWNGILSGARFLVWTIV